MRTNAPGLPDRLLLLDLDGVVVTERAPNAGDPRQILLLHEDLPAKLQRLGMPVAVLTHRSRREAHCILQSAGLDGSTLAAVFAAEDLFLAGLRPSSLGRLASRGLRKSLILPVLQKRFGVAADNVVFIDDRIDNIKDLARHGLGLGLHAPSNEDHDRTPLMSFDFDEALREIARWIPGTLSWVTLEPVEVEMHPWRRTGTETTRHGGHLFNRVRTVGSAIRQWVF